MTVLARDESGKPTIWCDPCIAPMVSALNSAGVTTIASCCGHGKNDPSIALEDGRWLVVTNEPPVAYEHRWKQAAHDAEVRAGVVAEEPETPEQARAHAMHDAFWAVHVGRFHGRDAQHGVDTFYAGTNAAKRAIEDLHGSPIIRPWEPVKP
jgi:hypothetical protein